MKDIRREYEGRELTEATAGADPLRLFEAWFAEALQQEPLDANAMTLATVSAGGEPSARIVLLKGFDARGFVFYTNYDSAKAVDLAGHPRASLLFFWSTLARQVRITGTASKTSPAESDEYFHSRPVDSQIAALASPQSRVIPDRATLDERYQSMTARHAEKPVPMPPFWGGYRVLPDRIEFWQGRPSRLHDRLLYVRKADGTWGRVRLAP